MRGFIVICLCAMASASPQGYNYNPQAGVAVQQPSAGFGSNFGAVSSGSAAATGAFFQGGQVGGIQQPSSYGGHQQVHQQQQQQQPQQVQAIVSKRFFIHSAPEDEEEDYREKLITVGVPKKNYNVVFIKSPSKAAKKTAIKIRPAPTEEKTVIYVLNKKTDASDIHAEVIEHPTTTSKPEVFFIKYKTNEEAAHAQEQIQAQYDSLGGTSQVSDEGVAPVTSVIGSLGGGHGGAGSNVGASAIGAGSDGGHSSGQSFGGAIGTGPGVQGGTNGYLPPNFY